MKVRDSGMPDIQLWNTFFNPKQIFKAMQLDESISMAVDFGCGYGTFSIPASKIVSNKVIGIDIDPEMLKITGRIAETEGIQNLELVLWDFMENGTGIMEGTADYVMMFNILHAQQPEKILKEAHRILKVNGIAGIVHWNFDNRTPRGPGMDIRPRPEQCILWAENCEFEIKKGPLALPPFHYGIICKKKKDNNKE